MTLRELLIGVGINFNDKGAQKADSAMSGLISKGNSLIGTVVGIGAALGLAFSAQKVVQMSDEWKSVEARVALTTKNAEEQKKVLDGLYSISQDTRQEYTATADLYSRMARGSKELGLNQEDLLKITETVNKAMVVGGGSTIENESAIRQLGQALGSGKLQGDELRSIMENAPRLFQAIADGMGVTIGQLRAMGKDGTITAEAITKALLKQKDVIEGEFGKMPMTIGQSTTKFMNAFGKVISEFEKRTGFFKAIADSISNLAGNLDKLTSKMPTLIKYFKLATIAVTSLGIAWGLLKVIALAKDFQFLIWAMRYYTVITARAAMATIAATWPFVLLAIAIAFIILLLEDIYVWMNGGESMMGEWLGSWDDFSQNLIWLFELWYQLKNLFEIGIRYISALIRGDWIGALQALKDFWSSLGDFVMGILSAIGNKIIELLNMIPGFKGAVQGIQSLMNFDFKGTVGSNNAPIAGTGTNIGQVNVTVQTNSDSPAAVGNAAAQGTEGALNDYSNYQLVQ